MKNKIQKSFLFLLSIFLLTPVTFAQAYNPASELNNLIELQQLQQTQQQNQYLSQYQQQQNITSQQDARNQQTENNLKNTYGLSDYYACYSKYESSCGLKVDMSDPYNMTSCLNSIKYCLESNALSQSRSNESSRNQITCSTGTVLRNGVCISNDQSCRNSFGQNFKWDGTKNDKGALSCGCKDGYTPNNGECVLAPVVPVKTNQQICEDYYGTGGLWSGQLNGNSPICGCQTGYELNSTGMGCILAPVVPPKNNDQICQDQFGSNSNWAGTKTDDGRLHCGCQTGYNWNAGQTACVAIPATPVSVVSSSYSASVFTSTLSTGFTGNEVTMLQGLLTRLGFFQGDATGYFGPKTASAVKQYQQSKGLEAVGIIGPRTRLSLNGDYK